MTEELNDTTRKYPRTLNEAFPDDPNYAEWLDADEPKTSLWVTVASVVGILAWAMFLYYLICLVEMKGI